MRKSIIIALVTFYLSHPEASAATATPAYYDRALDRVTELESEAVADLLEASEELTRRGYRRLHRWWLRDAVADYLAAR